MSPLDENARSHININAENKGPGSQYIHDGYGDMNMVTDIGQVNKIGSQYNSKPTSLPLRRVDIIAWLMHQPTQTPLNFHSHHNELLRQVAQGTGEWILHTDEDSYHSEFRIKGSGADAACVYFYFQEKEEIGISSARIWATLLIQLIRASGELKGELKAKFETSLQGSTRLYSDEYLELFKARAATIKTVYLFIDALDSCQNSPEEDTQRKMRKALESLPDNIRILITSRDDSVGVGVGASKKLLITPKQQDVETYVRKRIEDNTLLSARGNEQYRNDVIHKVTAITLSSKMFLLARLHMDNLSKQGTLSDIKKALDDLPDSEFKIFDTSARQIAQKIKPEGNDFNSCLTRHILTWVIHAKVDLTAEQICDSFAVQRSKGQRYQEHRPEKKHLMPVCKGLVIMDQDNETLKLVHKSVQTHLERYRIIPENASLEIGKTCLSCLLIDTSDQKDEYPLLKYAAKYWWAHLGRQGQKLDPEAESLTLEFLRDSYKLTRAFKAIELDDSVTFENMTGLHAVVYFDLMFWAERLLETDIDINAQCSDGQTALHWAVRYGRCELTELFINKSANPNIHDSLKDTPLHKALMGENEKSTFHLAITSTDNNINIAKALVKGKARLDIKNRKGLSPMLSAIRYGPTPIAKIMVENQDDVDAEIFDGWTSLRHVFNHFQGSTEGWAHARCLTDLLLERGVNLNRPSVDGGWTPLIHAAKFGDTSKLKRLLMRQPNPADVHLPDQEGKTVKQRDSEMVRVLIKLGANVNTKTESRSTLLIEATKLRDHDVAWVLLNAKAVLDGRDAEGKSALSYAIESQDKALAWLLMAKNGSAVSPNKNISNKDMQEALALAMKSDSLSIAWLLCEHGALPSATLLCDAAKRKNYKAAQFLIERGATADIKDAHGSTPLHYAVRTCQDDLADLLASRRLGLDIPDSKGNTALILATLKTQCSTMQALLRYGASCKIPGPGGLTALHFAAAKGFNKGLNLILDRNFNSDPNAVDDERRTALHLAVNGEHANPETVGMLVKAGARMEVQDKEGRTPLMLAAQLGKEELVCSLLAEGANVQTLDNHGRTAITYADGSPNIQRLLQGGAATRP
ncbi:ankyrin repeat-containing domain protein [Hypoxylon sp. NC1633]|nr:ankyrin repeat-containing domain protein [Hypoxylon sp. NC1633]